MRFASSSTGLRAGLNSIRADFSPSLAASAKRVGTDDCRRGSRVPTFTADARRARIGARFHGISIRKGSL